MQNDIYNNRSVAFISKSFLDGDYDQFISEYETHLISFIEWERLKSKIEFWNYDIVNLEKEFINRIAGYIYQKNQALLIVDKEEIKQIERDFLIEKNISSEILEDAILNIDKEDNITRAKERQVLIREYALFKFDREDEKTIEQEANKKIVSSYNHKIHYLKYRANLIGFKPSFEKGIKFNDFETDHLLELTTHSKFSKPQKFIILKELGIIDFLKEKYSQLSENGLGKILKDITGETNYQDKLSGHTNQGANDPYNNKKNVETIKQHLTINRNINLKK